MKGWEYSHGQRGVFRRLTMLKKMLLALEQIFKTTAFRIQIEFQ